MGEAGAWHPSKEFHTTRTQQNRVQGQPLDRALIWTWRRRYNHKRRCVAMVRMPHWCPTMRVTRAMPFSADALRAALGLPR